jgi:mRNA-degrading endonuclease YafQ of YafQ-DinJ toxin-antitoxin module
MNQYNIIFTNQFLRKYKKLTKNNKSLQELTKKKIHQLSHDPFHPSLRTHKYNLDFSTRISGDLRIIWNFTNADTLAILNFGGHEGKTKVYN